MGEEDEGAPNPLTSLEFCCPKWFRRYYNPAERFPGEVCLYHDLCLEVEHDMRRLRRQYSPEEEYQAHTEEEEIIRKEANKFQNRDEKISALWEKNLKEELEKIRLEKEEEERKYIRKYTRKTKYKGKKKYMFRKIKHKGRKKKYMFRKIKHKGRKKKYTLRKMKCKFRMKNRRTNKMKNMWKKLYDDSEAPTMVGLTDHERRVADGIITEWTFEEDGEEYKIKSLLYGTNRKHLINNKGIQVDIDQLSGKYILMYFLSLPDDQAPTRYPYHKSDPVLIGGLEELYSIHRENFEVVVVALGNNEHIFHDLFSRMPWLAIPHEDQEARDFFIEEFNIPFPSLIQPVLFAPSGKVVRRNAESSILCYGAHGFPFTNQSICTFVNECRALQDELFLKSKIPELTALLGNYVISADGNKEPTAKLKGKIVGLFFFESTFVGFRQTRLLLEIWKSLKQEQREGFVIVFINKTPFNLSHAKAEFKNKFRCSVPWYSLEVCGRKLSWIFQKDSGSPTDAAGDFIVLKPDAYQPVSYFASAIMENFGSDAYPFTLQRVVELAKRKQQNQVVLDKLLSPEAPLLRGCKEYSDTTIYSQRSWKHVNLLFGKRTSYMVPDTLLSPKGPLLRGYKEDSNTTTLSKLSGMRVLLLFATHSSYMSGSFLPQLKQIYEKKGTDDNFEIIYISLDCDESPSSFSKCIREMPWLIHAFVPDFAATLAQLVFDVYPPRLPAIAAFGPDGHLEAKESNLAFKKDFKSMHPFIADLDEVVRMELIDKYNWDLECLDISVIYKPDQKVVDHL